MLNTTKFIGNLNFPGQNLIGDYKLQFSQPTIKLTYTRNFGNDKLKEKRERCTGAEDEKGGVHKRKYSLITEINHKIFFHLSGCLLINAILIPGNVFIKSAINKIYHPKSSKRNY
jgi:hypothetical protein